MKGKLQEVSGQTLDAGWTAMSTHALPPLTSPLPPSPTQVFIPLSCTTSRGLSTASQGLNAAFQQTLAQPVSISGSLCKLLHSSGFCETRGWASPLSIFWCISQDTGWNLNVFSFIFFLFCKILNQWYLFLCPLKQPINIGHLSSHKMFCSESYGSQHLFNLEMSQGLQAV